MVGMSAFDNAERAANVSGELARSMAAGSGRKIGVRWMLRGQARLKSLRRSLCGRSEVCWAVLAVIHQMDLFGKLH